MKIVLNEAEVIDNEIKRVKVLVLCDLNVTFSD